MGLLRNWIQKAREKDEGQKNLLAFSIASLITLGIFFIWALNLFTAGPFTNTKIKEKFNKINLAVPVEATKNLIKSVTHFGKETYDFK